MTDFYTVDMSINTTAAQVVSAAEFDRLLNVRTLGTDMFVGFSASDTHYRLPSGTANSGVTVALPAGKELWAAMSTGTASIYVIVGGR